MTLTHLRALRTIVALFFFLPITFFFLDLGSNVPKSVNDAFLYLQIIPALLKLFAGVGVMIFGIVFIALLTLLFGRVYCSTICPLGILQDVVNRIAKTISKKRRKRNYFAYAKPKYAIHYSILAATAALFAFHSTMLLNLLEPFSNYGRIIHNLFRPILHTLNNAGAAVTERFHVYFLYTIPFKEIAVGAVIVPLLFLGLVVYLSYTRGRLFCNLLCPAGALLGLISRYTIFKIEVNESTCTDCGLCEKVCKAQCIESKSKKIDHAACIGCFNCFNACPSVGLMFRRSSLKNDLYQTFRIPSAVEGRSASDLTGRFGSAQRPVDSSSATTSRRAFLATAAIGTTLPVALKVDSLTAPSTAYMESRKHPVTPPGSLSVDHFTQYCTACHLCVTSCPAQVLIPSWFDYGIGGIFQPKMNYQASFCNYDCVKCTEVCPTGALLPLLPEAKRLGQMGKVQFVREDCIVVTKKTDCGACSEHCPTKAVHMVPEGKLSIPEVNNDICVGCGACEHACPVKPRKAIFVNANSVHLTAKKPEVKKLENPMENGQDFPF
jgi:ferredoxin